MSTLTPLTPRKDFGYWGDNADWLVAYAIHRDSDTLERSNLRVIRDDLESRFPDDVTVETFAHFLVGHTEELLVRPGSPAADAAQEWQDKLEDYPIADEDDFSELETEDALESAAEFVRCEYPSLREDAETVASYLYSATEDYSRWNSAGGWWPKVHDGNRSDPRDRAEVAAGLRAYRNRTR